MVNICNAIAFASVALVAAVSASEDAAGRHLQAVNFRQEMLDAVNAARKTEGLDAVCINDLLMNAAQVQANDMAENNVIKSTGSDGTQPKERAVAEGFDADVVTEVVGAGYRAATTIVAAWVKAASAKSTVLSKHTVMGPGYTFDKTRKYVHYWAVDFSDGECGNGTATASAGSTSGSGSVELAASSSGSGAPASSTSASGSVEAPGSGSAPASGSSEGTPASGSGSATPASGSGSATPASGSGSATPASGSGAETPASGSGSATPASGSGAATPASGSGSATPASGSGAETPASGSGSATPSASGSEAATPASETSSASSAETAAPATENPDSPNQ